MTTGDGGGSGSQWQKCSVVLTAVNWKKGCIGDGIFEFYELVYISIILFLCGVLCVGCVCVCVCLCMYVCMYVYMYINHCLQKYTYLSI